MVLSPVQLPDALLENVLAHLKGVRTSLHGWVACCPAHRDREPSLSIGLGDEGQVLLNCFAGCTLDRIVEAMGITLADLFPKVPSASDSQSGQTAALEVPPAPGYHRATSGMSPDPLSPARWHTSASPPAAHGAGRQRGITLEQRVRGDCSLWAGTSGRSQEGRLSCYRGGRVRLLDALVPPLSSPWFARRRDGAHA